jgi:hypothetical protein
MYSLWFEKLCISSIGFKNQLIHLKKRLHNYYELVFDPVIKVTWKIRSSKT